MANVIKHKRGSGSDPGASDLVVGEVAIRTDVGKLFTKMDNGSVAEIAGGGSDIAINTLSSSSATGGGSATFNGSAYRFTLSQPPSVSAQQLLVSINGVIQKPVAGTGQPSEGFSVDGTDIILGDAPATGADFFILTFKSLGVSEPADNSVTSAKIVDGAIVNADVNASAAIAGTKISPDFGSQNIATTGALGTGDHVTLSGNNPHITFTDSNHNPDFELYGSAGIFQIWDSTNNVGRLIVNSDGHIDIAGNLDVGAGIDVTGNITATGTIETTGSELKITGAEPRLTFTDTDNNPDFQIWANAQKFAIYDSTNSETRLHIDSSGNVGIGTTSPGYKLEVVDASVLLKLNSSNEGNYDVRFVYQNSEANIWSYSSSDLTFGTRFARKLHLVTNGPQKRLTIDDGGQVGIGTTSPQENLHILSSSGSSRIRMTSADGSDNMIVFGDTSDQATGAIKFDHSDNSLALFGFNNSERMRIDSSGNVLIGTTSATAEFTVQGSGTVASFEGTGGSGAIAIRDADAGTFVFLKDDGGTFSVQTSGSSYSDKFVIDTSGNVRVVSGDIRVGDDIDSNAGTQTISVGSVSSGSGGIGIFANPTNGNSFLQFGDGDSTAQYRGYLNYRHANDALLIGTAGSESMRIDSAGSLLLGATSYGGGGSSPKLYVSTTSDRAVKIHNTNSATSSLQITNAATGQGDDNGMQLAALANGECIIANAEAERILIQSQEADNNKPVVNFIKPQGPSNAQTVMIAFETGNQGRGAIKSSSSDGGLPSLVSASDYRIKTNIRDYTAGYDTIKAIPVKLFDMTSDGTKDIKGWIAHEVQSYIPEAVMGDKDAVDSNGDPILQNLGYGTFMPDVVGALQTAIAKIETLEAKIEALEAK